MKRFLLTTASLALAFLVALLAADVVALLPAEQSPIVCPEGSSAVWSTVRFPFHDDDLPNLSCRDDQGRPHGPNFNWADGHLLGLSFYRHGEPTGTTVTFYGNGSVWVVRNASSTHTNMVSWSNTGVKEYEEIRDGGVSRWSSWHANGNLKAQGNEAGKNDAPYFLPDGSFNEDRKDSSYFVGEYRSYYENGHPKVIGFYRDGVRDGDWTCSDESGEHTVEATFSEGRLTSRTGDVDADHMEDRCQESSCGQRKDHDPTLAEGGPVKKRCSPHVS